MTRRFLAVGAALNAFAAILPAFADPGSIGVNAAIRNVVNLKTYRDGAPRPAVLREAVHIGDVVFSGTNSALQVLLRDESVFTVGANARMTIDRFVYDPNRGTGAVAASIARGAFRFMSGRAVARNPGQIAIKTPVASIGVRGTVVEVLVGPEAVALMKVQPNVMATGPSFDPEKATVVMLQGPGPNRQGLDKIGAITVTAGGRSVDVGQPGFVVIPGPSQAPLGPFPLTSELTQHMDESLRTQPNSNEQRAQIQALGADIAAAVKASTEERFKTELAKLVLANQNNPAVLQAAFALVADGMDSGSDRYTLLMAMSYVIATSTGAPPVGALGSALASADGLLVMAAYSRPTNLAAAVAAITSSATGSNQPSLALINGFNPGSAGTFFFDGGGVGGSIGGGPGGGGITPVVPVPEPASWIMMIVGFGMVGGAVRFRHGKRIRVS